jgi:cobalt-zinc-cadmium efflux system outer membrane protein
MRSPFGLPGFTSLAIVAAFSVAPGRAWAQAQPGQIAQLPSITHAEAQPTGPPVSLSDLLRDAVEKNPELIALRQQVGVVRQRPLQERSLTPPMAEVQVWQWPFNSINPADTNMYMFMVTQDLPGRGKRDLRAAVAEKDVSLAESDVAIRARDIVNQIKQAYASLYIARKAIQVHLESVELLRQIADISQAKYTTGRISQQDVLKPVLELSRLHNDIISFDEQAQLAGARLNVLLGRAPETPIGPLIEPRVEMVLPTTADLQRLALERQPELQRARLEIERAEAELASVQRDYKPDFSIQGGYMLMPRMTDAWTVRVGITWPNAPWSRAAGSTRAWPSRPPRFTPARPGYKRWRTGCAWPFRKPTCARNPLRTAPSSCARRSNHSRNRRSRSRVWRIRRVAWTSRR